MTPAQAVRAAIVAGRASSRAAARSQFHAARRREAVAVLVEAGWSVSDIADALGVSRSMAYRLMVSQPKPTESVTFP